MGCPSNSFSSNNSPSPTVDVYVDGALAIEDFTFRAATPVLELPLSFTVGIAPADGEVIAEFTAPLSGLGGGSAVVFASGFLSGDDPAFGLFAAPPNKRLK